MRNLLLSDDYSVVDDTVCPPPTVVSESLGHLLSTVAQKMLPGGVLMFSGHTWPRLLLDRDQEGEHATAGPWTARIQEGDLWIRWTRDDKHAIWTCELDQLKPGGRSTPLIHDNPIVTAMQLHQWTERTGQNWIGTPGMSGNALLMGIYADRPAPRWQLKEIADGWPAGDIERPYGPRDWYREYTGGMLGYDLNQAYLAALQTVALPFDDLSWRPGGQQPFHAGRGGIWRVELARWPLADQLPDPAGYAPVLDDGSRWVTSPTLELIDQLVTDATHPGYAVRESWTASTLRLTRAFAEGIHDLAVDDDPAIARAAKRVYKETYGMWRRRGRIHRPDWHYSVIAMARSNLWRKLYAAHQLDHPAPVRIETDCVFYPSGDREWAMAAPANFRLDATGRKLGAFKPYEPKADR